MNIGFLGAGKVGSTLGKYFSLQGLPVTGYYSRHRESADAAAAFTESHSYHDLRTFVHDCDVLFLTVPDDSISAVFTSLKPYPLNDKLVCHCSGALTAREAFPGIGSTGASALSIHPLVPISSKTASYPELAGAFFCLEGDDGPCHTWSRQLTCFGNPNRIVSGEGKARYHAAAAIASNLTCSLLQESCHLLAECGFSEEEALAALAPLVRSNLEHILSGGPTQAQTGPVERNDLQTIQKHLSVLDTENERELYRSLTRIAVELAQKRHPETDYEALRAILKGGTGR